MIFEKYINGFSDYLRLKNFSKRTDDSYCFEVKKLIFFISENYTRIKNIAQINKNIILDYLNYLMRYKNKIGKALSSKTIKLKIAAIRHFFKYLLKSDFILKDPTLTIESPKEERSLPKNILTESEVKLILDSINTRTPIGLRNKTIIELFYSCGMRTSELCDLKIHNVDLKEQTVIIEHGKGDKMRILPLGQYAVEYIDQYLLKARKFMLKGKNNDEGYLFLTVRGKKFNRDTINKCVVHEVVKNLKLNKNVTCYSMRHALATHLVQNKVDIRFVQELSGHESLNTTQKYCHLNITDLKKMHALYHPREASQNIDIKEDNKEK